MPKEFRGALGRPVKETAREALDEANTSGAATIINLGGSLVTVNPGDGLNKVTERAIKSQSEPRP